MPNRPDQAVEIYRRYSEPIIEASQEHLEFDVTTVHWANSLVHFPILQIEETLWEVVRLSDKGRPPGGGENQPQTTLAMCLVRYAIELVTNVSYVLLAPENERKDRETKWLKSRTDFIRSEGFTGDLVFKEGPPAKRIAEAPKNTTLIINDEPADYFNLADLVKYDPFGKTFFQKLDYVPTRSRKELIRIYREATIISHAYFNSIWPQASGEHPVNGMIGCCVLLLKVTASAVGCDADYNKMGQEIVDLYPAKKPM